MSTRYLLFGLLALLMASVAYAQPFTYQGFLKDGGNPANGNYNMTFRLFSVVTGGTALATVGPVSVSVSNGLFTRELNFGSVWDGADRWLEIQVGATTLSPRVKINPTPYAIYASTAATANPIGVSGGDLSGSYPNPTVARLQGRSVANTAPNSGDILKWNGSSWAPSADLRDAFWQASGSNIFYSSGNVGIGTSSPNRPLTIQGTGASSQWLQFMDSTGVHRWHLNHLNSGLNFAESGVADGRLFLAAGGNVGIGTATPAEKLHVMGNLRLRNDADILGLDRIVGFNDLRLAGDDDPAGTTDLIITSDGRVGHRVSYSNSNFNITNAGYEFVLTVERADGRNILQVLDNGRLYVGGIRNIGDFRNMQWNQSTGEVGWDTSSRRYKENIAPLEDDYLKILHLEPKTYTRIGGEPDRWEIGYIAEEVHELGLTRLVEYDLEGRPDGVNYEKMVLYLNEVIKRQQGRIAELEKRIEQLEKSRRQPQ